MELYFLRHGPAASRAGWDLADADRPLTDKGRTVVERVVLRLAGIGVRVDAVATSPYLRARQTAEIAAEAFSASRQPDEEPLLRPGFDVADLETVLEAYSDARGLVLVGHEPDFSLVAGEIIGGADLALKKAGVALVELKDGHPVRGRLRWLLTPDVLR